MVAKLTRSAPVFPVRDLPRTLAHYESLGFEVASFSEEGDYGFAERDGVQLHFTVLPDLDPATNAGSVYLYVTDADALAYEWSKPGIGGETRAPADTNYGLREGAHLDLDNNLLRFGSPLLPQSSRTRHLRSVPPSQPS